MSVTANKPKLSITGVLIQDPTDKGYTAYFAEFPEVIAEGKTEDEAVDNAFEALRIIFEFKKEEYAENNANGFGITQKSFELELA